MTAVTLCPRELSDAASVGIARTIRAMVQGRRKKFDDGPQWTVDIEAACSEKAYAKLRGWYWPGATNPDREGDVRSHHVRSTAYETGHLIVRPKDPPDGLFVLMVGSYDSWRLAGWCSGVEARCDEFRRARDDSRRDDEPELWWVPQHALHPGGPDA